MLKYFAIQELCIIFALKCEDDVLKIFANIVFIF